MECFNHQYLNNKFVAQMNIFLTEKLIVVDNLM
jgi:hypothetical protein